MLSARKIRLTFFEESCYALAKVIRPAGFDLEFVLELKLLLK